MEEVSETELNRDSCEDDTYYHLPSVYSWDAFGDEDMYGREEIKEQDQCTCCGRSFNVDIIMRHKILCLRAAERKRRLKAKREMELASNKDRQRFLARVHERQIRIRNWRTHHSEFINAISSLKNAKRNGTVASFINQPTPTPSNLKMCPTCGRNFNSTAYVRHVQRCKEETARRQKELKSLESRLSALKLESSTASSRNSSPISRASINLSVRASPVPQSLKKSDASSTVSSASKVLDMKTGSPTPLSTGSMSVKNVPKGRVDNTSKAPTTAQKKPTSSCTSKPANPPMRQHSPKSINVSEKKQTTAQHSHPPTHSETNMASKSASGDNKKFLPDSPPRPVAPTTHHITSVSHIRKEMQLEVPMNWSQLDLPPPPSELLLQAALSSEEEPIDTPAIHCNKKNGEKLPARDDGPQEVETTCCRFCYECGSQYHDVKDRFCGQCGTPRFPSS